jgi:hypothetical protein
VRTPVLVLVAVLTALLLPATASAAKRRVPFGFFGVTWDSTAKHAPGRARATEWTVMSRSGVESVRVSFDWASAQHDSPAVITYQYTDALVAQAARHGLPVMPVVEHSPQWAKRYPDRRSSPPKDINDYVNFLTRLIDRYGPEGTFWDDHPNLPRLPVDEWQIWNEPELSLGWDTPAGAEDAWPGGYVRLLAAAYTAVKDEDPGARVVAAGMANDSWNKLQQLYVAGGEPWFDAVAFHLYSSSGRHVLRAAKLLRRVMRRNGDRRKPLFATEVGCPASRGRLRGFHNFATNDRGMAHCATDIYRTLAGRRRWKGLHLERVYWHTWGTNYHGRSLFDYSGLRAWIRRRHHFYSKPALRAYTRVARRYEGCAKRSTTRCRRRHHRRHRRRR